MCGLCPLDCLCRSATTMVFLHQIVPNAFHFFFPFLHRPASDVENLILIQSVRRCYYIYIGFLYIFFYNTRRRCFWRNVALYKVPQVLHVRRGTLSAGKFPIIRSISSENPLGSSAIFFFFFFLQFLSLYQTAPSLFPVTHGSPSIIVISSILIYRK